MPARKDERDPIAAARRLLGVVRQQTDSIGLGLSFGKDSLATLDLCARMFKRVEAYYLYRVLDLEVVESWREQVRARFGVETKMIPHWDLCRVYRYAVLQPHWFRASDVPKYGMAEVEAFFRQEAKVEWCALGWRRTDSYSRAMIMKVCHGLDFKTRRVFPLMVWRRGDVLAYLASRKIVQPPGFGRKEQGGLDFHPAALRALSPADQQRWLRDFPFAVAQLVRDKEGRWVAPEGANNGSREETK